MAWKHRARILGLMTHPKEPAGNDLRSAPSNGTIELCGRETALLAALESARGRVITRTELARAAGLRQAPRRVDVHLVNVRRHLQTGACDQIVNVRGRGWILLREELSPV